MAIVNVETVVEILLQKLADSLIQEADFLHGFRNEVECLKAEFGRMQCFLKDADDKQEGDERVKNWVRDVRDVAYDAEDVIDTFIFKIATSRKKGFVGHISRYAFFCHEWIAVHKVGSEIVRIKNKIRSIFEIRWTYGIENIVQDTSSADLSLRDWRRTYPLDQEPDFVGFKDDLEMLVDRLIKDEPRRCVVSVVGIGGLGKTALIKKVYNKVQKHFNTCAWINVLQEYSVRDLLQEIIRLWRVLPKEKLEVLEKMHVVELRGLISEYLNDRRYLVVLDDIRKEETLDDLKDAFPDRTNGSRVMLTTRNRHLALYADPRSPPYELRLLNKQESLILLRKKIFHEQDRIYPKYLQNLGEEIVGKCQGLPLAINVIGGLLSGILSKTEEREWENVSKKISRQFVEAKSAGIYSFSYKHLPSFLKPCFLYLSNFPKDYEFHTKELIRMWAAEGLIKERGELAVEEVGEYYLLELLQRSMVQVARRSSSGGIKSFGMVSLLWDLSKSIAMEADFLQVHSNINASLTSTAPRLAIHHNDLSKYISLSHSTPRLRSVLIYTQGRKLLQREQENFLYRGFKLLRVLYLHGACIKKLPMAIGELLHLRYLGCTNTLLERLPSSIANLPHLQTLSVASLYDMKVPGTVLEMQHLRHLQVEDVVKSTYLGWRESWRVIEGQRRLDRESNLQTLTCVEVGEWMVDCLGNLTNLRKLGIRLHHEPEYYKGDSKLYASIAKMDNLQSLSVVTRYPIPLPVRPLSHLPKLSKLRLEGRLEKSSEFPRYLTKLTLAFSLLNQDQLATLEKLENLCVLRLLGGSYREKEMACTGQGFPALKSLHLQELSPLEVWRVEEGAMPKLLHLQINECLQLKELPEGLQRMTNLKKLEVLNMHDQFKERLREDEGEDWHKIQNISSVDIS